MPSLSYKKAAMEYHRIRFVIVRDGSKYRWEMRRGPHTLAQSNSLFASGALADAAARNVSDSIRHGEFPPAHLNVA